MHHSSHLKARLFVSIYGSALGGRSEKIRVLEVGSKSYHEQDTYRDLFPADRFDYRGLDLEAGRNVDIVPANPFLWREIEDCSFDICVSGQTFEHNPYFWITFAEIARVLRPGGMAFIVAPGAGHVHRYPVDCWRFYPDSWASLASLTHMELVETYFETDELSVRTAGGSWRDSAAIVRKPELSVAQLEAFHRRLSLIGAIAEDPLPVVRDHPQGPWVSAYKTDVMASPAPSFWRRFKTRLPKVWTGV